MRGPTPESSAFTAQEREGAETFAYYYNRLDYYRLGQPGVKIYDETGHGPKLIRLEPSRLRVRR